MSEMYFTRDPSCASCPVDCSFVYRGKCMTFRTDAGVFSKGELDPGTDLLLQNLPKLTGDVLDMGCGWGPIGVAVAKTSPEAHVTMADVNLRALALTELNSRENGVVTEVIESDGFAQLQGRTFDTVVTNPPIRAGKQVIYKMFADAAASLREGGALYLVIRKQQGGDSCIKYLKTLFAQVEKLDKSGGYWILRASGKPEDTVEGA